MVLMFLVFGSKVEAARKKMELWETTLSVTDDPMKIFGKLEKLKALTQGSCLFGTIACQRNI